MHLRVMEGKFTLILAVAMVLCMCAVNAFGQAETGQILGTFSIRRAPPCRVRR